MSLMVDSVGGDYTANAAAIEAKKQEMLRYYETALTNWREVREQITQMLPKEKQKSYREITKQMHARLYNDLVDLKEIRY